MLLNVFHGSPIPNLVSLKEKEGSGQYQRVAGIYFSKNRAEAEKYTKIKGIKHPENIIEAQVRIENPANREVLDQLGYGFNGLEMREKLKSLGYDGVIDDLMDEVIVFEPSQIIITKRPNNIAQWILHNCKFAQQQNLEFYNPHEYKPAFPPHMQQDREFWEHVRAEANPNKVDPIEAIENVLLYYPAYTKAFLKAFSAIYNPNLISFQTGASLETLTINKEVYVLDSYSIKKAEEWIQELGEDGVSEYIPYRDFNKDFWADVGPGYTLYHATSPDNIEGITKRGLLPKSDTRGLSNKYMGDAVFTGPEPSSLGAYGDAVIEIHVDQMKAAGYMPEVSQEEPFVEEEMKSALAHKLGVEYYPSESLQSEGIWEDTIAFYGKVPPKFLTIQTPGKQARAIHKNCKYSKIVPQYLYVSDETPVNIVRQAWDLVKTSGINILSDKTLGVVAIVKEIVVGALFIPEYGEKFSFDIIVHPKYQRQGIGMELAKIGKNMFDSEQYPKGMELDAVSPGGKYISEKLGLEKDREIGEHSIYHLNLAWVHKNCKFAQPLPDYKGEHSAPMSDSGSPLHDLANTYPDDFYSEKGFRYYGNDPKDYKSISLMQQYRYRMDKIIRIYRAIPLGIKPVINRGDWVTIDREYAKEHGENNLGHGKYRIISKVVPARDIFTNGDSVLEWGYDPQPFIPMRQRDPKYWPGWMKKKQRLSN